MCMHNLGVGGSPHITDQANKSLGRFKFVPPLNMDLNGFMV